MRVVDVITSSLIDLMCSTDIGASRVQGVPGEIEAEDCCTCILNVELCPAKQHTLDFQIGIKAKGIIVLNRTAIILDIFAQHAAATNGQL